MRIIIDIEEGMNRDVMVINVEGLDMDYFSLLQKIGSIEKKFNSEQSAP